MKLIGYTGDEVAWQAGATTVATRTANERRDLVGRYLRAVAKGRRDYVAAFIGPDGKPKDGLTAPSVVTTIAKYVGQPAEQVKLGIS